jgi:elongation factor Ts
MTISATDVKALRDRTGAGMMECKGALQEANGDIEKAIEILRVRGQAKAAKRGERQAAEGVIGHYVHSNDRIGVLVEVNCETDFVARNEEFKQFAGDVALHVAAAAPLWVSEDDVPADVKEAELQIFAQQAEDKPEHVRSKTAEGKLRKWLEDVVLLDQPHVNADKYEGRTIEQIRAELASKTGENVVIRRFARFAIGD